MTLRTFFVALAVLAASSCVVAPRRGRPREYREFTTNSAACTKYPAGCAALHGVASESGSAVQAVGVGLGLATVVLGEALDYATESKIDAVVKHCADMARADVMLRHFGNRSPTHDDCNEQVTFNGQRVPKYLQLGDEMHQWTFACLREKLGQLIPGQFSIEPRYRHNDRTSTTTVMSPEEVDAIVRDGRFSDLEGTIVPDLVIHNGSPRYVREVYDFKFPCVNTDKRPKWRQYPPDHRFADEYQNDVYRRVLGKEPLAVTPILGVLR